MDSDGKLTAQITAVSIEKGSEWINIVQRQFCSMHQGS